MATNEPPGSPSSSHGSREEKEKNVDEDLTLRKAEEEVKKFLPGRRFAPTDHEIVMDYLKKRVEGQLSPTHLIKNVDDVFNCSPDKLFRKYKIKTEEGGYFFSPLKECSHGKCIATEDGFWKYKNTMTTFSVLDGNGDRTMVGRKKQLQFFEKNETVSGQYTNWDMQEYSIPNILGPAAEKPIKVDDIALCKIYNTDYLKKADVPPKATATAAVDNKSSPENQFEGGGGEEGEAGDAGGGEEAEGGEEEGEREGEEGEGRGGEKAGGGEEEAEGGDDDIADNDPPNYRSSSAENQLDDDNSGDDTSHDQSSCAENQLDDAADTFETQSSSSEN